MTATATYDLADRLASATVAGATESYAWSGDGLRLSAATGTQASRTVRVLVDGSFALPTVRAQHGD